MYINRMINHLQEKPLIGIIAGFAGTFFASLKEFVTNDSTLDGLRIAGIWLGFMIALLTGLIKIIELLKLVRSKK